MIRVISKYELEFTKPAWKQEEDMFAGSLCLKKIDGGYVADIRSVNKKPLMHFMNRCFPILMKSPDKQKKRSYLFEEIKKMYDSYREIFMSEFLPRLDIPEGKKPFEHQIDCWYRSIYRQHNLFALDMGLGKTFVSASISQMLDINRTIVICPSLVKWNWYRELTNDWGYNPLNFTILDAKPNRTIKAFQENWCIVNFEMVTRHMDHLMNGGDCRHIIVDEVHYCKNHLTKTRYKPIEQLVKHFPNARITLLSGTPITNRVIDMFAYLKLTGNPLGDNYEYFKKRYTRTAGRGKIIGAKNIPELSQRLSNFMIRRITKECIDLPELIIKKYYFKSDEFRTEYNEALDEFIKKKMEYDELPEEDKAMQRSSLRASLHTLNRVTALSKLTQVKELVNNMNDEGKKVVIFCSYRQPLQELDDYFGERSVQINGSVTAFKRDQYINEFINNPKVKVFLGQNQAAGIGINLVNSNDVIFLNFPFTPDQIEQPYKRLHRIGQKNTVRVCYTICEDTVDENIFEIVAGKSNDINALLDKGKSGVINYHDLEEKLFNSIMKKELV